MSLKQDLFKSEKNRLAVVMPQPSSEPDQPQEQIESGKKTFEDEQRQRSVQKKRPIRSRSLD